MQKRHKPNILGITQLNKITCTSYVQFNVYGRSVPRKYLSQMNDNSFFAMGPTGDELVLLSHFEHAQCPPISISSAAYENRTRCESFVATGARVNAMGTLPQANEREEQFNLF